MAVDVFQGKYLQLSESLAADVTDNIIGYLVVDDVHYPLSHSRDKNNNAYLYEYRNAAFKINIARSHDAVNGISRKDRNIKRKSGGESRKHH